MKNFLALAAAFALSGATTAQAAVPPCLTPAEFTALTDYAMPSAIRGAAARCSAALPANAYLRTNAEALAHKYDAGKARNWPAAKGAFLRVGAVLNPEAGALFKSMPDAAVQPIVDSMMTGLVGQKLPLDRCASLDRLVTLLSPLPADNVGELFGLAAGLYAQDGRAKLGQFSVCKASN